MPSKQTCDRLFCSTVLFLLAINCAAQNNVESSVANPVPEAVKELLAYPYPPVQRSLIGGLWMTDASSTSTLIIKNNLSTSALTVHPVLFLGNGKEVPLSEVNLKPNGTARVDLGDALSRNNIAPYAALSGYVEIRYTWAWDAVTATVKNTDLTHSVIYNYSLDYVEPRRDEVTTPKKPVATSKIVDGMWWKETANVSGFVAISNTQKSPVEALIAIKDERGEVISTHSVEILSHETKMLDLPEIGSTSSSAGGISISYNRGDEGILTSGALKDLSVGYSANIPFSSSTLRPPSRPKAEPIVSTVAELGLLTGPADPMMSFPAGTVFTPYSVVRNISSRPIIVEPELHWMEDTGAHSAVLPAFPINAGTTKSLNVMAFAVAAGVPRSTTAISLMIKMDQEQLPNLLMVSGSVDKRKTFVFGVDPALVSEHQGESLSYWSTGDFDDTMVTLWNPSSQTEQYIFTLFFADGQYQLPLSLNANSIRSFNISEIIQNQTPDLDGHVIPLSVHEGSAQLTGARGDAEQISVSMDASTYNVRKATCGHYTVTCQGSVSAFIESIPVGVAPGVSVQTHLYGQQYNGTQYEYTSNGSWNTSDINIATVSLGNVSGINEGSFTLNASFIGGKGGVWRNVDNTFSCPGASFFGSGAGSSHSPINTIQLITDARQRLTPKCDQKFGAVIPNYTNAQYFSSLSAASISQYPNAGPNVPIHTLGIDASTDTSTTAAPITLWPNFYGLDRTTQAFVLLHEGIHHFTRWDDATIFANFKNSGLVQVNPGTGDITTWIQNGCQP